jgi:hypothetical protein
MSNQNRLPAGTAASAGGRWTTTSKNDATLIKPLAEKNERGCTSCDGAVEDCHTICSLCRARAAVTRVAARLFDADDMSSHQYQEHFGDVEDEEAEVEAESLAQFHAQQLFCSLEDGASVAFDYSAVHFRGDDNSGRFVLDDSYDEAEVAYAWGNEPNGPNTFVFDSRVEAAAAVAEDLIAEASEDPHTILNASSKTETTTVGAA